MNVDKKIKINLGLALVILLSFIPMFAWKIGFQYEQAELWRIVAFSFAKIGAFGGMAMFALSLILSGRYRFYDKLFGGLDKMYIAHRFLGTFSIVLLFIHPLSLSILAHEGGFANALSLWFNVSDFGVWLGAMALYGLLAIGLWSIVAKSKYETFVKVHRLLGVVFIIGAAHAFLSGSILAANSFMYWYLLTLTVAGAATYFMYTVLGDTLHRPLTYKVEDVQTLSDTIVELTLSPSSRIISFRPGQFVYVSLDGLQDHGYHPFSIRSSKRSSKLVLAIRCSGDFTTALQDVEVGTEVKLKGPYGGFVLDLHTSKKQLWIAGGIGVTPFLSGAESLRHATRAGAGDIEMIYTSAEARPYGIDTLQSIEEHNDVFNVTHLDQDSYGFVSFQLLSENIRDLKERDIYICGPPPMLNALIAEAEKGGFSHRLKYEEFSY